MVYSSFARTHRDRHFLFLSPCLDRDGEVVCPGGIVALQWVHQQGRRPRRSDPSQQQTCTASLRAFLPHLDVLRGWISDVVPMGWTAWLYGPDVALWPDYWNPFRPFQSSFAVIRLCYGPIQTESGNRCGDVVFCYCSSSKYCITCAFIFLILFALFIKITFTSRLRFFVKSSALFHFGKEYKKVSLQRFRK